MNSNNAQAYFTRAFLLLGSKQTDRAISDFSKAININPKFHLAYFLRGGLYEQIQQYDKAIDDVSKVIAINPNSGEAYYSRALIYDKKMQHDKARQDLQNACDLGEKKACEKLHQKQEQHISGNKTDNDTEKFSPKPQKVYIDQGFTYLIKRQYDKAIGEYNKAIALSPDDVHTAPAYHGRGTAYGLKEQEKAISDPTYKGQYDRAISDLQKACALDKAFCKSLKEMQKSFR